MPHSIKIKTKIDLLQFGAHVFLHTWFAQAAASIDPRGMKLFQGSFWYIPFIVCGVFHFYTRLTSAAGAMDARMQLREPLLPSTAVPVCALGAPRSSARGLRPVVRSSIIFHFDTVYLCALLTPRVHATSFDRDS